MENFADWVAHLSIRQLEGELERETEYSAGQYALLRQEHTKKVQAGLLPNDGAWQPPTSIPCPKCGAACSWEQDTCLYCCADLTKERRRLFLAGETGPEALVPEP